jgi:hypothetical protein
VKLYSPAADISSYSSDTVMLAINRHPLIQKNDSIRLNIAVAAQGTYKLNFSELYQVGAGVRIYLEDKFLHTLSKVNEASVYSFNVTEDPASQGSQRFALVFDKDKEQPTGMGELTRTKTGSLSIYPVPSRDMIYIAGINQSGPALIRITDMLGKTVWRGEVFSQGTGSIPVSIADLKTGVYMIMLEGLSDSSLTGKFIKE